MREVNFSIPIANKASVGITTALYDRRALDCTSTLPLINSLNNLAYLTTSSGRIRDILTVDGGIERLVCILKEGRSKDMMEMWKTNLAFQCIVNIGIRGSEAVRTRVVEADMVPVIATILDNYLQVIEKCRERADAENRRKCPMLGTSRGFGRSSSRSDAPDSRHAARPRRQAPPPISIPEPREDPDADEPGSEVTPTATAANMSLSSPPERTSFPRQHHYHRSHDGQAQFSTPGLLPNRPGLDQPMSAAPLQSNSSPAFGLRPVRDIDRLPSMIPTMHAEMSSQPQSPATPSAPLQRLGSPRAVAEASRPRRRPSIRHQLSTSGSDDNGIIEETSDDSMDPAMRPEPVVGIQTDIIMQDVVDEENLLQQQADVVLAAPDVSSAGDETFNITHHPTVDGSLVNPAVTPTQGRMAFPQTRMAPPLNVANATPPNVLQSPAWYPPRGLAPDRPASAGILAAMPRDEDVLMSLQLLAYVSKYCYLRSYFQQSRLVPRLKIGKELRLLDADYDPSTHSGPTQEELDEEWDNEFVPKPDEKPFNIFPLIEKFTAKPSSSRHHNNSSSPQQGDMQYWAGVVMRNLCRKDEKRGGIRQCAYWQCGKWEEYTRQFAKCRRCRRTKYCSKECQKGAWGSHRFWCDTAQPGDAESAAGAASERHRRHAHAAGHGHHRSQGHHHHHHHI